MQKGSIYPVAAYNSMARVKYFIIDIDASQLPCEKKKKNPQGANIL